MNWGVSEIVGVATFVVAVGGSIARVIWKQAVDSNTLSRVESEVKIIQARKDVLSDQVGKHDTEIAVIKEGVKNIDKKLDVLIEKTK